VPRLAKLTELGFVAGAAAVRAHVCAVSGDRGENCRDGGRLRRGGRVCAVATTHKQRQDRLPRSRRLALPHPVAQPFIRLAIGFCKGTAERQFVAGSERFFGQADRATAPPPSICDLSIVT